METDFLADLFIVIIGLALIFAGIYIIKKSRIRKKLHPILELFIVLTVGGLCYFLISRKAAPTELNIASGKSQAEDFMPQDAVSGEKLENCVICREDEIIIDNSIADMKALEDYLDYRVENNIQVVLVDDYSTAGFFNSIVDHLNEKGVKYIIKDETWFSE
ncbi:MAG: hypothetical protein IJT16_15930 [Lachnospiraceae bacterium]|nr:hypothetical protein [Lachnospiraceae bacterium]